MVDANGKGSAVTASGTIRNWVNCLLAILVKKQKQAMIEAFQNLLKTKRNSNRSKKK